ncbi:alpha/beta fold hydrolase [Nonomuraea sp. NPDC005692]|uniref:thioesterase II family protein n=1 Tax=Nonomuraea sp. NPDC005692 TaxID=3157168 RepID=UPI0033F81488
MADWLRCPEKRPLSAVRLFCFPHAGGSAAFYRSWAENAGVEIHAVQYPGRGDRWADPLIGDLRDMAHRIADAMTPLLDRPVALFGHSMGALVAYEVARELAGRGVVPARLFVSGANPPQTMAGVLGSLAETDDETLAGLMGTLNGTDPGLLADPELLEIVLSYVRSDLRAVAAYEHREGAPLDCPIHALHGDADHDVVPERVPLWGELTRAGFTVDTLAGDHFYLVPRREQVMEIITRYLHGGGGTGRRRQVDQ